MTVIRVEKRRPVAIVPAYQHPHGYWVGYEYQNGHANKKMLRLFKETEVSAMLVDEDWQKISPGVKIWQTKNGEK